MGDPRHRLGVRAESVVAERLSAAGWLILARRWRCPAGELDLIGRDPGGALVGVEVRARRTARQGRGLESVDRRGLARRRAALAAYARAMRPRATELRLDLVTLEPVAGRPGRWRMSHLPGIDAW